MVPRADEPLADPVVDVAGDAPAIELLQFDGPLGEALELGLAALEAVV
jgi:hypothetical protein